MKRLFALATCMLSMAGVGADELKPTHPEPQLETVLAKFEPAGKQFNVTLKLAEFGVETRRRTDLVTKPVQKIVDGKPVQTTVQEEVVTLYQVQVPLGFREVKLLARDAKVMDMNGTHIVARKAAERLKGFTPTLMAVRVPGMPDPLSAVFDPFWRANIKEDTLVVVVDYEKIAPKDGKGK